MRAQTIWIAAAMLVLALAAGSEAGATGVSGAHRTPISPDAAAISAAVGGADVIVSLRTPAPPRLANGTLDTATLRASVDGARARVLAAAGGPDFVPARAYQSVPAVAGRATATGLQRLAALPDVASISLNRATHADLLESAALIQADAARTQFELTGSGVTVAVLDSGIQTSHPMLSGDIAGQACFLANGGCPGGGTSGPTAEDDFGHGTYVSGIVTSSGPSTGIAPGAKIFAYKVINSAGTGTMEDVLSAYDDIISNHPEVRVINMSIGDEGAYAAGSCEDDIPALTAALATTRAMGIVTFASSGNTAAKNGIAYPACLNDAVSVGAVYDANVGSLSIGTCTDATTAADQVACFSQSGDALDLLAPGSKVTSTYLGGGMLTGSGTSAAAPMAAGVAALLLEEDPSLTASALELRLRETGVARVDPGNGLTTCRVDAFRAAQNLVTPACVSPGADTDGDGIGDAVDNCTSIANTGQENFDGAGIDNGPGLPGIDTTVPDSDHLGDACDPDRDNDGVPDAEDIEPLAAAGVCAPFAGSSDGHANAAGGDNTDLDGSGPSWDTDGDGVRDGAECALGTNPRSAASRPSAAACGGGADADVDGLPASAETCKWGTSDASGDSDGDGLKDCIEANDTNGDGVQNFPGDTVNSAKAANGVIVRTLDFDLNGDASVNFPGDTILSAKMVNHIAGICP